MFSSAATWWKYFSFSGKELLEQSLSLSRFLIVIIPLWLWLGQIPICSETYSKLVIAADTCLAPYYTILWCWRRGQFWLLLVWSGLDLGNCNFGTIPEKLNGLSDCTHLCKLIPLIMIMQCFLLIWTCAQWMYSEGVITTWQLPPRLTQSTAGTTLTCNRVALLIIVILKCFQTRPKINCAKVYVTN